MSSEVTVPFSTMEAKNKEITAWLETHAGQGSARYGGREGEIKHWLNGEDWLYYNQYTMGDLNITGHLNTVFVFRDERIATEFALRFA